MPALPVKNLALSDFKNAIFGVKALPFRFKLSQKCHLIDDKYMRNISMHDVI